MWGAVRIRCAPGLSTRHASRRRSQRLGDVLEDLKADRRVEGPVRNGRESAVPKTSIDSFGWRVWGWSRPMILSTRPSKTVRIGCSPQPMSRTRPWARWATDGDVPAADPPDEPVLAREGEPPVHRSRSGGTRSPDCTARRRSGCRPRCSRSSRHRSIARTVPEPARPSFRMFPTKTSLWMRQQGVTLPWKST